jgi:hypothetical protein
MERRWRWVERDTTVAVEAEMDLSGPDVNVASDRRFTVAGDVDRQGRDPRHPCDQTCHEIGVDVLHH